MDLKQPWSILISEFINSFVMVYTFFDPPKPKLSFKDAVVVAMFAKLLYALCARFKEMSTLQKIADLFFCLVFTYFLCKNVFWIKISEKVQPHLYQFRRILSKIQSQYPGIIIFFCVTIVVIMYLLVVLHVINTKPDIPALSDSIQLTEEAQPPEVPINANQTCRMMSANALSIPAEKDWENGGFWGQCTVKRHEVKEVQFCKKLSDIAEIRNTLGYFSWSVSAKDDDAVIACFHDGMLWVAADGIIELSQDSSFLFAGFTNLERVDFNDSVDSSYVTDMSNLFAMCKSLVDVSMNDLNTENVESMFRMFYHCDAIKTLDLTEMDTPKVKNMGNMFSYCSSLTTIDVSCFSTGNVTDMGNMFYSCSKLESVDVSNFDTGKLVQLNGMFYGCSNLKSIDFSNFNFSHVTEMRNVFYGSGVSEIKVSDWPNINKSAYSDFMSHESKINGIEWEQFSNSNLSE